MAQYSCRRPNYRTFAESRRQPRTLLARRSEAISSRFFRGDRGPNCAEKMSKVVYVYSGEGAGARSVASAVESLEKCLKLKVNSHHQSTVQDACSYFEDSDHFKQLHLTDFRFGPCQSHCFAWQNTLEKA